MSSLASDSLSLITDAQLEGLELLFLRTLFLDPFLELPVNSSARSSVKDQLTQYLLNLIAGCEFSISFTCSLTYPLCVPLLYWVLFQ